MTMATGRSSTALLLAIGFCLGVLFTFAISPQPFSMVEENRLYTLLRFSRRAGTSSSDILKFGNPGPVHDLLERTKYVASYNRRDRVPDWVGEHLTADSLIAGPDVNRDKSSFKEDTEIPSMFRALLTDYVGSGYDRGHMAPAADAMATQEAMDETFLLSNMAPQVGVGFNRQYWAYLEGFVRDLTKNFTDVYVYSGPLFLPQPLNTGKSNPAYQIQYPVIGTTPNVAVPTHFYKIVLTTKDSSEYALGAFVLPNQKIDSSTPLTDFQVNLTVIEKAAGLQFFDQLDRSQLLDLCRQVECAV